MMSSLMALDAGVLQALYAMREMPVVYFFIGVTELGGTLAIGGFAACAALILFYRRMYAQLAGLVVSVGGSAALVFALKELVQRARPDLFYQAYRETDFSFPSGHAALSLALYGFLVFLVLPHIRTSRGRYALIAAAVVLVFLISFSRLYLGVHYVSDVLGSWLISSAMLWLAIQLTKTIDAR